MNKYNKIISKIIGLRVSTDISATPGLAPTHHHQMQRCCHVPLQDIHQKRSNTKL